MGTERAADLARRVGSRIAFRAASVLLADLLVAMVGFSIVALLGLWIFAAGWLYIATEYAAVGVTFAESQVLGAWAAVVGIPFAIAAVILLGFRAFQLPLRLWGELHPSRATTTG